MVTPAAKREAVAHLQALLDVSERRACRVIAADRTVIRYQSRRDDDEPLREKLRDLAHQRRRFGYRRLHILLRRELTDLIAMRGKPGMIVSDNGTELTSNAVLVWCGEAKIEWHYTTLWTGVQKEPR